MIKKQKHIKVPWVIVDDLTNKIRSCGSSNCRVTFEAQPVPAGCSIFEYSGGIKGALFVNGEMVTE
jgi:hypothetical protein